MAKKRVVVHKEGSQEYEAKIDPATLITVKVVEIKKEIEVPVFTDVEVERPVYVDKDFERPVIVDKEYERPVIIDKEYERPVIVSKEFLVSTPIEVEVEYDKYVPKEVSYDIPVVSMEAVAKIAAEVVDTISMARSMLKEINSSIELLNSAIDIAKASIPKKIIMPEIITEEVFVKDVKIIEDTIHVIGKVVARSQ
jgi:hypothetical protein